MNQIAAQEFQADVPMRNALTNAVNHSRWLGSPMVRTEHVLLGVIANLSAGAPLRESDAVTAGVLDDIGVQYAAVLEQGRVGEKFGAGEERPDAFRGTLPASAREVLRRAARNASGPLRRVFGHPTWSSAVERAVADAGVGRHHQSDLSGLLLALLADSDCGAYHALRRAGIDPADLVDRIRGGRSDSPLANLSYLGRDVIAGVDPLRQAGVVKRFALRATYGWAKPTTIALLGEAVGQAYWLGSRRAGPDHLLLAYLAIGEALAAIPERDAADPGFAGTSPLREAGVSYAALRRAQSERERRAGLTRADAEALADIGIDLERILASVRATFGPGAVRDRTSLSGDHDEAASAVLRHARALAGGSRSILPDHIAYAVLGESPAHGSRTWVELIPDAEGVRQSILRRLPA